MYAAWMPIRAADVGRFWVLAGQGLAMMIRGQELIRGRCALADRTDGVVKTASVAARDQGASAVCATPRARA
jgi:hypothetical protein